MSDTKQAKAEQPKDRVAEALYEIPETSLTSTEIEDKLIKARIEMLISAPFFGIVYDRDFCIRNIPVPK